MDYTKLLQDIDKMLYEAYHEGINDRYSLSADYYKSNIKKNLTDGKN